MELQPNEPCHSGSVLGDSLVPGDWVPVVDRIVRQPAACSGGSVTGIISGFGCSRCLQRSRMHQRETGESVGTFRGGSNPGNIGGVGWING